MYLLTSTKVPKLNMQTQPKYSENLLTTYFVKNKFTRDNSPKTILNVLPAKANHFYKAHCHSFPLLLYYLIKKKKPLNTFFHRNVFS